MAGSPPSRPRSFQYTSPSRTISEILGEDRNSEVRHKLRIETAWKEHERVREDAERALREHNQKEEQRRLLEEKRREEERIRRDEQIAAERIRLNALKAKKVEIPPVLPDPEPPKAPPAAPVAKAPESAPSPTPATATTPQLNNLLNGTTAQKTPAPLGQPAPNPFGAPPKPSPFTQASLQTAIGNLQVQSKEPVAPTPRPQPPVAQRPAPVPIDRYTIIHTNLKALRTLMTQQAKVNKLLKQRMGDMRRDIRKSVGQLTGGPAGTNRQQQNKIMENLREALANQVGSQLVDPNDYLLEPRSYAQGGQQSPEKLPSLFLYLLNQFAKAAISQFVNEASARPETADPVGVCIAATFSDPNFQWRGQSLIDILMAKFRIVCPVLFGFRGSEKTLEGRKRLGWKKEHGSWVDEQVHMDRMTGLGAGFAAVSLRNFSKTKKVNPYPPRNYWTAMAKIVNTPSPEISNTQAVVLKAMIQNYEQKFLEHYGSAAIAALRMCLFEFPARVPAGSQSAAINSLGVLATQLQRDSGLVLT
ncbi:Nucleoporin GLE1 [Rhypophila decipiens]|uniref:mRNA export factor GLE1 n=1 Tax=Rhypophila decipiens TaxID=261697 RepID=A0AAN6Y402_9PEZI|nr:Nucleoporin GLE1 [Rhypophila decipiens]